MASRTAELVLTLKDFASNGMAKVGSSFDKFAKNVERSKFIFAGIATVFAGIGTAAITASGKMEQWRIAFNTMLGSAERADVLLKQIRDFAAQTPFELPQVVEGSKRLLAYGIEAEKVIETFKVMGDITSGIGTEKLPQLITAFGQVKAATKLTGQEMRQFTEAGVPLIQGLADHFGVAEKAIFDMVSQGKVGFADVQQVLVNMTSEGGRFANGMANQMQSLFGVVSNVKDSFFTLAVEFGQILLPVAREVARQILNLTDFLINLSPQAKLMATVIAGLVTAFTGLLGALGLIISIAPAIAAAWAVIVGPFSLAMAAIAALTASLWLFHENFLEFRDIMGELFTEFLETVTLFALALRDVLTFNISSALENIRAALSKIKNDTSSALSTLVSNGKSKMDEFVKTHFNAKKTILENDKTFNAEVLAEDKKFTQKKQEIMEADLNNVKQNEMSKQSLIQSSLSQISSLQQSHSKGLFAVGKAAAIANAIISTHEGAAKALSLGPFIGPALAAAITAAGFARVHQIGAQSLPFADGGIVLPRRGGTLAQIGEAGSAEAVIPLDDRRAQEMLSGGSTININAGVIVADKTSVREFAEMLDEELFRLQKNNRSVAL